MADAGNSRSVHDFVRSVLNAVTGACNPMQCNGSSSPAHRQGIWNFEFSSLSTEVNLSLLVVSLLLSAFSALDCKLVTALEGQYHEKSFKFLCELC